MFRTLPSDIPSSDICEGPLRNLSMCPLCDTCEPWLLDDACVNTQIKYVVDNGSTIFFSIFVSIWASVFIELWKRYSAEFAHRWNIFGFDPREEHPRPEYLSRLSHVKKEVKNYVTKKLEPKPSLRMLMFGYMTSWGCVIFFIIAALGTVFGIVFYRMAMMAVKNLSGR